MIGVVPKICAPLTPANVTIIACPRTPDKRSDGDQHDYEQRLPEVFYVHDQT
jgi:hypothetical protein